MGAHKINGSAYLVFLELKAVGKAFPSVIMHSKHLQPALDRRNESCKGPTKTYSGALSAV